jgi:hypothetical protein
MPASLRRLYAILFTPIVRPGRGTLVRQHRSAKPRFGHLQECATLLVGARRFRPGKTFVRQLAVLLRQHDATSARIRCLETGIWVFG